MFTLLETIIGFTVIMLLLSYVVKSLTSVVKNHFDYYSGHLETEVRDLVMRLLGKRLDEVKIGKYEPFKGIDWKQVGEEFLTADNFEALLGPLLNEGQLEALKAQLEIHKGKMNYAFSRRMKNLSLACGLALCLIVNINAFTIWQTLYNDGQTRAKFAAPEYVQAVLQRADGAEEAKEAKEKAGAPEVPAEPAPGAGAGAGAGAAGAPADAGAGGEGERGAEAAGADQGETAGGDGAEGERAVSGGGEARSDGKMTKAELAEVREMFTRELASFTSEVNFGVGRIYDKTQPLGPRGFLIELLASLLTGILVSVGAPYWHDLLRSLSRVRGGAQPASGGAAGG